MLRKLHIEHFKSFGSFSIEFDRINLLVGGNNSGKTTIFHALQFFFWALEQIATKTPTGFKFGKTQTSDVPVLPYAEMRDLFHQQRMRSGKTPQRVAITLSADDAPPVSIALYQAYVRNFMISGDDQEMIAREYETLQCLNPVYVPSTVGITSKEDYYRPIALRSMIH